MEIHRIDLKSETSSLIKIDPAVGWVRSNFLEEDIAGCIITDRWGESLKVHLVNWRTKKSATIDTMILVCYHQLKRIALTLETVSTSILCLHNQRISIDVYLQFTW
jgi:hypothetical protein